VFCTLHDKWFPTHGEGRNQHGWWRLHKLTRLCVLLYSPPGFVAWIDKPKTLVTSEGHLVISINIRVNRTARRLEKNTRNYTEGGSVAVRGLCVRNWSIGILSVASLQIQDSAGVNKLCSRDLLICGTVVIRTRTDGSYLGVSVMTPCSPVRY
jgi:hypothetical protein